MNPSKTFNLILPFSMYRELKRVSVKREKPVAELIRQGIDLVLKNIREGKGDEN